MTDRINTEPTMAKMTLTPSEIAIASDEDNSQFNELSQEADAASSPAEGDNNVTDDGNIATPPDPPEEPEADEEPSSEDTGSDGDWVDDDVRSLARGYGLTDDDLGEFSGREDFDRFGRVYDRQLMREKGGRGGGTERPPDSDGAAPDSAGAAQGSAGAAPPKEDTEKGEQPKPAAKRLDVEALRKAGWDEEFIQLAEIVNSQQEENESLKEQITKVRSVADRQHQEETAKQEEAFHQLMDETDPDLFGKAFDGESAPGAKLTTEQLDNRRKVWETMVAISNAEVNRARAVGAEPPPLDLPKLQRRATQAAFGGKVGTGRKPNTAAVRHQSTKRRPVSTSSSRGNRPSATSAPRGAVHSNDADVADIVNAPDVVNFWNRIQQENGA